MNVVEERCIQKSQKLKNYSYSRWKVGLYLCPDYRVRQIRRINFSPKLAKPRNVSTNHKPTKTDNSYKTNEAKNTISFDILEHYIFCSK